MDAFETFVQTGDWKSEKHVPILHFPESVKADKDFELKISLGDAINHPNTFEHYISWFKVYYWAKEAKFPVELATVDFAAHGENGIYTDYKTAIQVRLSRSGTIYALSYCNIHGLWGNQSNILVE